MLKRLMLVAFLLPTFRTYQFFPGLGVVHEVWFVLSALMVVGVLLYALSRNVPLGGFGRYLLLLVVFAPIWSALASGAAHGQPLAFGLLAQRGTVLIGNALILLIALQRGFWTARDIVACLVGLAWFAGLLHLAMVVVLEPSAFVDYGRGFVEDLGDSGHVFKFQAAALVVVGILYHATRAFRSHQPAHYLGALILLAILIGQAGGRIMTASILLSLTILFVRWSDARRVLTFIPAALLASGLLLLLVYLISPDATLERFGKFGDAFTAVLMGAEVDDVSADSRRLQILLALPAIADHLWMGSGNISYRWLEGGQAGILGDYFFATDIGVLGVVYTVGLIGTLVYLFQYRFALGARASGTLSGHAKALHDLAAAFVLYSALSSVGTGMFVFTPEIVCLFVAMLVHTRSSAALRLAPAQSLRVNRGTS